jgi:hypothetical protein
MVDAVADFDSRMEQWTIADDEEILLSPEYKVARYCGACNLMAER